jgi:hypothetical protein
MVSPMRVTAGISTAVKGSALWNFPAQDPTKVYHYFNDFHTYAAADWTVTRIGTTPAEALLADEPFGALRLTVSAADNDGDQLQLTTENFTLAAGKKAWFKTRFKVSDATQSDLLIGLAVLDTTLLGAVDGAGVTDGIFFSKEDGDALIDFNCQKNATTGQTRAAAIATLADDTYMTLGYEWDGVSAIKYFVNEAHKGTLDLTTTPTAYLPDTPVTVSMAILNGEAVAKLLTVDYLFAAIER